MEKIKISGTYGDPVKLYLDGYVYTKYGNYLKIKSVDQEKQTVYCYGDQYDYSRIGCSSKNNDKSYKEYENTISMFFERLKLKVGSVVNFNGSEMTVKKLFIEDYFPFVLLENDEFLEKVKIEKFIENPLDIPFTVISTPYTLKERYTMHLKEHSRYNNEIKDVDLYIESLLELIKNNE